jgi:hypothetical protein
MDIRYTDHAEESLRERWIPIDTLRDGSLKATIWKNSGEKGDFYSVDLTRTYKQGDQFKDSNSSSGSELLRIARLAHIAYDEIAIMRGKASEEVA